MNDNSTILKSYNLDYVNWSGGHMALGVVKNIGDRTNCPKNLLEKIGDAGLWVLEELPAKVWHVMKDPRVITIALTAFAILAASFIFYPISTWLIIKAALAVIPFPPLWAIRFAAYIFTVGIILATACRAFARFNNTDLMNMYYYGSKNPNAKAIYDKVYAEIKDKDSGNDDNLAHEAGLKAVKAADQSQSSVAVQQGERKQNDSVVSPTSAFSAAN